MAKEEYKVIFKVSKNGDSFSSHIQGFEVEIKTCSMNNL